MDRPLFQGSGSDPQGRHEPPVTHEENDTYAGTFFLGRYRVVDEIGVGGMASVHLARVDGPGGFQKWVAIKRIHPHLVEDDSFVNMFLDEARIAAQISHPNVATVFELGSDDDTYWIAMEYLHGEPVREVMRRLEEMHRTMPPEIACRIIIDAAEGLHAAHELTGPDGRKLELVHRDVTPHNLFVTYEGVTKVVDFGIAKFSSRISETRAGTLKGKIAYMSPEHVSGEQVDCQADIFGLGVVLWELTTGCRLFRADTELDTLARVQECRVPAPTSIHPTYPLDLQAVVMKALARSRMERYRTARELSRALQQVLVRRGLFVGHEELSTFMKSIFVDRMEKREAHLRWAAEVTQTVDVQRISRPRNESESSLLVVDDASNPTPAAVVAIGSTTDLNALAPDELPTLTELPPSSDESPSSQEDTLVTDQLQLPRMDGEDDAEDDNSATPARGTPSGPPPRQELKPVAPTPAISAPPSAPTAPFSQPGPLRQPRLAEGFSAKPSAVPTYSAFPTDLGPTRPMQETVPITRVRAVPVWMVAVTAAVLFMTGLGVVLLWPRTGPVVNASDPLRDTRRAFSRAIERPEATTPAPTTVPMLDHSSAPREPPPTPTPLAPTPRPHPAPSAAPTPPPTPSAIASTATPTGVDGAAASSGFLTVVCVPACDQVMDNGRALGASPIVKRKAAIGAHRLHLMWSDPPGRKLVSATVTADKNTLVRESRP
jgi:serine/threonine-protein kinase